VGSQFDNVNIIIDPKFRRLIRPLRPEEHALLEASLRAVGCLDTLKVWGKVLLDGHNRLAICRAHNIPFMTAEVPNIGCRQDAIEWIHENQLGRRNLTDNAFAYFLGKTHESRKRRSGGDHRSQDFKSATTAPLVDTAEGIAEEKGVSRRTVMNAAEFARNVDAIVAIEPEAFERLLANDHPLSRLDVKRIAELPEN
jgi:hypothetical protein